MRQEIRDKLADALESGDYLQGRSSLRAETIDENEEVVETRFCVLGVLCDLHAKETGRSWKRGDPKWDSVDLEGGKKRIDSYYAGAISALPPDVKEWAGVEFEMPRVPIAYTSLIRDRSLTMLNDTDRWSFERIAKLLREIDADAIA